ncbi:hypothetical protein C8Q74DRAFT_235868 [Fomes fomentarius]|nr:hypothetical protein C8Q74DRAFT_235868 [Fomes fomentarius]
MERSSKSPDPIHLSLNEPPRVGAHPYLPAACDRMALADATMPNSSPPEIPTDVFRLIFTHLEADEDGTTLSTCALVSRLWRDTAQPNLFSTIVIRRGHSLDSFHLFLQKKTELYRWTRKLLVLNGGNTPSPVGDDRDGPAAEPLMLDLSIISRFTCLRHLQLQNVEVVDTAISSSTSEDISYDNCERHTITGSSSTPAVGLHLDVLELEDITTRNAGGLSPLQLIIRMLSLSSIGVLTIDQTPGIVYAPDSLELEDHMSSGGEGAYSTEGHALAVSELMVIGPEVLAEWKPLSSLRPCTFTVAGQHICQLKPINNFLRHSGERITALDLGIDVRSLRNREVNVEGMVLTGIGLPHNLPDALLP